MIEGKFVLVLSEGQEVDEKSLRYLLVDALADFIDARANGDAAKYVRERYSESGFNEDWMQAKIKETGRRISPASRP